MRQWPYPTTILLLPRAYNAEGNGIGVMLPAVNRFGLTNARRHLRELDASEPGMPPFDASFEHAVKPRRSGYG
jgi:hypothetical protein